MTVYLFTGTPGSGKSLHMAELLYWQLKMKRPVIANYEINLEAIDKKNSSELPFYYAPNDVLTPHNLEQFARWYFKEHEFREGAIKVFIDEAQIIFSNRNWQANAGWIKFFTQHRKMGMDVYIVAQFHEMIDKQIRAIVEYEVSHRKVNNVGWFGRIVSLLTFGHPVTVGVTRWYGQKMRLGAEWFLGRKKFYSIYDTYKLFDSDSIRS